MNNNCDHKDAVVIGLIDTIWQTYLMWECPVCDAEGTMAISREKYNEIAADARKLMGSE